MKQKNHKRFARSTVRAIEQLLQKARKTRIPKARKEGSQKRSS